MELKNLIKEIQDITSILNKIVKPKTPSQVDYLKSLQSAIKVIQNISMHELITELEKQINITQIQVDKDKQIRREVLILAAKEAEIPYKRFSDFDRIMPFKVLYRDKKVQLEVGSEKLKEIEGVDGKGIFEFIQENRALLEREPFERGVFFRFLKYAYRLAKEVLQPGDGWVPIRTLYSYFAMVKHIELPEFIKKPEAKNFRNYSSAQFVYDLARFGQKEWTYGDAILKTRTPNMVTVASGQTMTLPNLDSIESPGQQLAVLKIDKREL